MSDAKACLHLWVSRRRSEECNASGWWACDAQGCDWTFMPSGNEEHGVYEEKCGCEGCHAMVPGCWPGGMCVDCATEDCDHPLPEGESAPRPGEVQTIPVSPEVMSRTAADVLRDPPKFPDMRESAPPEEPRPAVLHAKMGGFNLKVTRPRPSAPPPKGDRE